MDGRIKSVFCIFPGNHLARVKQTLWIMVFFHLELYGIDIAVHAFLQPVRVRVVAGAARGFEP